MTAQTLYNKLQSKEISKEKFLYEVRKQTNLPITKFNSFEDTVKILKNRGIISESTLEKYKKEKENELPEVEIKTIDQVSPYEYSKGLEYELDMCDKSIGQNMPKDEEMEKIYKKVLSNLTKDPYYYSKKEIRDKSKKNNDENQPLEELGKNNKAKNQMKKVKPIKENSDYINAEDLGFNLEDFDLLDDGSLIDPETNKKVFNGTTGSYDRMYLKKYLENQKSVNENLDQYYSQDDEDLDMDLSQPEGCESCDRDKPEIDMDVMDPNELERLSRIIEEWGLTANDIHDVDIMDELANEFMRRNNKESEMNEGVALTDSEGNISYVKDEQSANKKIENARKAGVTLTKQTVN